MTTDKILFCPLSTTGETPSAWIGPEFGGREDYSLRDWQFSGCIDAPDLVPSGATTNRNFDQIPVSTYVPR